MTTYDARSRLTALPFSIWVLAVAYTLCSASCISNGHCSPDGSFDHPTAAHSCSSSEKRANNEVRRSSHDSPDVLELGLPSSNRSVADKRAETVELVSDFGEESIVGMGSLVEGKYLLLEQLHPTLWAFSGVPEDSGSTDGQLQIHLKPSDAASAHESVPPATRSSCYDDGGIDQSTTWKQTNGSWSRTSEPPYLSSEPRSRPLLLPPGIGAAKVTTGAALAAAVVSVRFDVVISRQAGAKSQGFCIDPSM
ncbi:hypothetical protein, conserved [Eimeria necatrix]|uniref:Transmembrane protein n=1 Tax=Eimeria necatrix TaxID=51315 RepID=U6N3X7_9EIME|nr:hypothetical protein, conserved [Eimeria necatrix]CDJ68620.1 hypothetical protein, conserved [Eimeria necatrix]